jgi:hypothetical protein
MADSKANLFNKEFGGEPLKTAFGSSLQGDNNNV